MQGHNEFELKGQARRLKTALAEMQIPVTHSAALNLIARIHNERNWEALEASLQDSKTLPGTDGRENWLRWLEAMLRMQDIDEEYLDDLVYDVMAAEEASSVNNQGVFSQLDALLRYEEEGYRPAPNPRLVVLEKLQREFPLLFLPLPEATTARRKDFIPMSVSVCAGSPQEQEFHFDALEWYAAASTDDVQRLSKAGLHSTDASDQVALWLLKNSQDKNVRLRLEAMMAHCKGQQELNPSLVGLTVIIEEEAVDAFLQAMQMTASSPSL